MRHQSSIKTPCQVVHCVPPRGTECTTCQDMRTHIETLGQLDGHQALDSSGLCFNIGAEGDDVGTETVA